MSKCHSVVCLILAPCINSFLSFFNGMVKFMSLAFKEVLMIKNMILCEIKVLEKFMKDPYSNLNSDLSVSTKTVICHGIQSLLQKDLEWYCAIWL